MKTAISRFSSPRLGLICQTALSEPKLFRDNFSPAGSFSEFEFSLAACTLIHFQMTCCEDQTSDCWLILMKKSKYLNQTRFSLQRTQKSNFTLKYNVMLHICNI
ncbi:hypothetical protein AMECASPLE_004294 [Ameca splendens]|uniref:Uncharacterized protein n=1 Tax=Ameca splendens TaxID=208324 RepID=A0ABV0YAK4_9TELE